MDINNLNKEDVHNLLVLKAGEIERANRLREKTDGDLFLDTYECQRMIGVTSKFFEKLVELLEPTVTYEDLSNEKNICKRWSEYELYGQNYKIMSV